MREFLASLRQMFREALCPHPGWQRVMQRTGRVPTVVVFGPAWRCVRCDRRSWDVA